MMACDVLPVAMFEILEKRTSDEDDVCSGGGKQDGKAQLLTFPCRDCATAGKTGSTSTVQLVLSCMTLVLDCMY